MKVFVTSVASVEDGHVVHFECDAGQGRASWMDRPPMVGDIRHVELEIQGPVVRGKDLTETSERIGVSIDEDATVLIGTMTRVEDEGYARLEFGCGGLDLEVEGDRPVLGGRYRVLARGLRAYDCDY